MRTDKNATVWEEEIATAMRVMLSESREVTTPLSKSTASAQKESSKSGGIPKGEKLPLPNKENILLSASQSGFEPSAGKAPAARQGIFSSIASSHNQAAEVKNAEATRRVQNPQIRLLWPEIVKRVPELAPGNMLPGRRKKRRVRSGIERIIADT